MPAALHRRAFLIGGSALGFSAGLALQGCSDRSGGNAPRPAASGPGPHSPFDKNSTAEQVTDGIDLAGKTVLLTGCNSGIGYETLRVLVLRGAHVLGVARNKEKAAQACASVVGPGIKGRATPYICEQTDFASVVACADAVRALNTPIDVLICNAGVNSQQFERVKGLEKNFVVNHLSHFILVNRLLDRVKASPQGRVVVVGSIAYQYAPPSGVEFDNLGGEKGYEPGEMYGQSKLANGLFARELARRLAGTTATANVIHPGVVDTKMNRNLDPKTPFYWRVYGWILGLTYRMKTIPQGAATTCYAATNPALSTVSGAYFEDCNQVIPEGHMRDDAMAAKLWQVSEELTRPYLSMAPATL